MYGFVSQTLGLRVKIFLSAFFVFEAMNDIFKTLCHRDSWEEFYEHKAQKEGENSPFLRRLRAYIDKEAYFEDAERLKAGGAFPEPVKKEIAKSASDKKRTVFTFPEPYGILLKFIARQLKRYDRIFAPNLYSFRLFRDAKDAWTYIRKLRNLDQKYVYKVDISDYFRSVEPERILPRLKQVLQDDEGLYRLLEEILLCPNAVENGLSKPCKKGILPGVPTSAFLANLFLDDLDHAFFRDRIPYLRYSDDIIVFSDSAEESEANARRIKDCLKEKGLDINTDKELFTPPEMPWDFLGFSYDSGIIDVSPVAFEKLKGKMRRKCRALERWADRKGVPGTYAAKAFVKRFHAKMFENPAAGELTWARWYFPVITTDRTLKKIDAYAVDTVRFLATGKRSKKRFDFRYGAVKEMGYRSLVNEYYRFKKGEILPEE